jgi:hypothetical protein
MHKKAQENFPQVITRNDNHVTAIKGYKSYIISETEAPLFDQTQQSAQTLNESRLLNTYYLIVRNPEQTMKFSIVFPSCLVFQITPLDILHHMTNTSLRSELPGDESLRKSAFTTTRRKSSRIENGKTYEGKAFEISIEGQIVPIEDRRALEVRAGISLNAIRKDRMKGVKKIPAVPMVNPGLEEQYKTESERIDAQSRSLQETRSADQAEASGQ